MYSRATTSAIAERWVLPAGFFVDDILRGDLWLAPEFAQSPVQLKETALLAVGIKRRRYVLWRRRRSRLVLRKASGCRVAFVEQ